MTGSIRYGPPWKLAERTTLIVGMGRSGLAAARLCVRENARVKVTDLRDSSEIDAAMLSGLPVEKRLGEHRLEDFTESDIIIVSPGVPLDMPELEAARRASVPIIGEVELAASFLTHLPMIAVTGTNGKSTTTALIGAMQGADGLQPFIGGNLGRALSEAVLDRTLPKALALELSSFQLDTCLNLRPDVSVLLNIASDHLDRHGTFESYQAAKAKIFSRQGSNDSAVVWGDDPAALSMTRGIAPKVYRFIEGDAPLPGAGYMSCKKKGHAVVTVSVREEDELEHYHVRASALRGPHNMANAAAAALACRVAGVSARAVQHALEVFPGLPHRLERVRVRQGVEWINDSKATNPESAKVALLSFSAGAIWIAGGRGKGLGYSSLVEAAAGRVKALLCIGEDGPLIAEQAQGFVDVVENCGTLDSAVSRAASIASTGDVVLLSPACASYDQFGDFEERGAHFRRLVEALQ